MSGDVFLVSAEGQGIGGGGAVPTVLNAGASSGGVSGKVTILVDGSSKLDMWQSATGVFSIHSPEALTLDCVGNSTYTATGFIGLAAGTDLYMTVGSGVIHHRVGSTDYVLETLGTTVTRDYQAAATGGAVFKVAGSARIAINGTGIGLYATAPVAQAARAGQLTDNSGGTSGGSTIAAITGAVDPTAATVASTANAIATLAARVNALELMLHNIGVSA